MQFKLRTCDTIDVTRNDQADAAKPAMNCDQVKSVKRDIKEPRQAPFDRHTSTNQIAHKRSNGRKAAE